MGTRWRAHPVHALEHFDAEVEAANVHRICPLSLPSSHFCERFGFAQRTGSSSHRSIDRRVGVVVDKLVLWGLWLERQKGERSVRTDNNFVVIICIAQLVHDFDDDADKISLARRQGAQHVKAACDKS